MNMVLQVWLASAEGIHRHYRKTPYGEMTNSEETRELLPYAGADTTDCQQLASLRDNISHLLPLPIFYQPASHALA